MEKSKEEKVKESKSKTKKVNKKKKEKTSLLELFATFFEIGLFTFGGGYAMIGIIEDICVEKNKWITHPEMLDLTVIAESTPGPISINCATYVGHKQRGILGSIVATLGLVLPSFLIILIIAIVLKYILRVKMIAFAFRGIKIAVGIIIVQAAIKLFKKMEKTKARVILFATIAAIMTILDAVYIKVPYIPILIAVAVGNIIYVAIQDRKNKKIKKGSSDK